MMLPQKHGKAFIFHLAAGIFTVVLLVFLVVRASSSPLDLFARPQSFLIGDCQFLLAAVVYYGFSSVLLRLLPLPAGRSVLYTSASWLFFLWAFYPVVISSGMMRRIAVPAGDYLAMERRREQLHLAAMLIFACIQVFYLVYVVRRQETTAPA